MGLLDDAIREHLDLKRRRGGDPAEIERAEREALGPVRRKGESAAGEDQGSPDTTAGSAYDEPDGGVATDVAEADPSRAWVDTAQEPPHDDPRDAEPSDDAPEGDWSYDDDRTRAMDVVTPDEPTRDEPSRDQPGPLDFADAEDEPFADEPRRPPAPSDATAEFDVEEALAVEEGRAAEARRAADEDEDVLEETPEFLQDTPDHDRLWFEQRPPRDFDFDG